MERIYQAAFEDVYPSDVRPNAFYSHTTLHRLTNALEVGTDKVVVDLGCCHGEPSLWVAQQTGANLIGIDLSSALDLAATLNCILPLNRMLQDTLQGGRYMFQIGEFSKIAQVSGRLLRYYDEIGLLSPEFTDPQTGYRYYSAQQLPRLNRILVLKELGLSLEQIARLVDQETSADEMRGMLNLRKAQIEQTLQEEMARLHAVETRLQQIETSGQIQEPDVVLKAVPAQPFLALRTVLPGLAAVRRLERRIATIVPAAVGQHSLGNIAMVVHSPAFDPEVLDVEVGYLLTGKAPQLVRLSQEEQVLTLHTLPAIETMATLVHTGSPGDIHLSYGALGTWIEHHGWQISGAGRHTIMHLSPVEEEEEAVIEVQLPVSKLDASPHFISVSTSR